MGGKDADLVNRLQSMFKIEAEERLQVMSSSLLELENTTAGERQGAIIETIFREIHSLKGAARAVNLDDIEIICQTLENLFSSLKRKEIKPSPLLFDNLYWAVDAIQQLVSIPEGVQTTEIIEQLAGLMDQPGKDYGSPVENEFTPPSSIPSFLLETRTTRENNLEEDDSDYNGTPTFLTEATTIDKIKEKPAISETVRISTAKLDSLLLQAEEMLSVKLAVGQLASNLKEIRTMVSLWKREWAKIHPIVYKNNQVKGKSAQDRLMARFTKIQEFIESNNSFVKSLDIKVIALVKSTEQDYRSLCGLVDNLMDNMKKALMFPFSSVLEPLPKMVRDISRARGKEADMELNGAEVEIDKRILEEMKDPLIHLLRNCIDHGIEKPEERIRNNKPRRGKICVNISQENSGKIKVLVSDDGAGVNLNKLKESVVRSGLLSEKDVNQLTGDELLSSIYQSEISTSPIITDLSGRGLGLAIVREKIERLGGGISAETVSGKGTSFTIILPVKVATFRGIAVKVSGQIFIIPTANVERVVRAGRNDIETVKNKDTIIFNGLPVALVPLADVLELPRRKLQKEVSDKTPLIILNLMEKRIALIVDEILNEQEVLVKNLGKQLLRVRNISGATILGSGKVVPILNAFDIIKSAVKLTISSSVKDEPNEFGNDRKPILVVEDSITSRMLLKNILESAGYHVKTAVDGFDALTSLRAEDFGLVVSDIEMPRINGLDLTARIRADQRLSHLPVVLVTGLESREDRERGIEVGANAYIVKSSFEHSNLLEIIRRLI